jgi:dTDP-4-amino-4,6-dideoxygalactose transaminase
MRPGAGRSDFEAALADRVGARYGIAFAYGRSGVIASLKALGLTQAEVIMPAYTCVVMAKAVVASGNHPVFVDIDLANYNMDMSALKRALTSQTRVVIATHMKGYPADIDAIRATVGDERVIILEDCAQGLPTSSAGSTKLCGDLGLFSFGPGKPTCTVQGGVIVTNSSDLYARIKAYRDKEMEGSSAKVWAKRWAWFLSSYVVFRQRTYGFLSRYRYRANPFGNTGLGFDPSPGALPNDMAMRYANFQARIGLAQLNKLDVMLAKRRALARLYDQELRDVTSIHPAPIIEGATYSFYTLRVPRRDEGGFKRRMASCGVSVDPSYEYVLPYLRPYQSFAREEYPRAVQAAREVINLPCYPHLQDSQARYIAACVRDCAREMNTR